MQGVPGGSSDGDGLPVLPAERDQEKLQTGEERACEHGLMLFLSCDDDEDAFSVFPGVSLRSREGNVCTKSSLHHVSSAFKDYCSFHRRSELWRDTYDD